MSTEDSRYDYPVEFVQQHVLGCFEASKACALLPGRPHLFHSEFIKRPDHHVEDLINQNAPLDFYTEVKYSPCEEVSWYLHTREKLPVYEGSTEVDSEFVAANAEGVIEGGEADAFEPQVEMWSPRLIEDSTKKERANYMLDAIEAHAARTLATVISTPEKPLELMTDTFGCPACNKPEWGLYHSRACKKRKSRFDKIQKELDK